MKHIFPYPEIYDLDIADGLRELLYEKKYDLQPSLAHEFFLGAIVVPGRVLMDIGFLKSTKREIKKTNKGQR